MVFIKPIVIAIDVDNEFTIITYNYVCGAHATYKYITERKFTHNVYTAVDHDDSVDITYLNNLLQLHYVRDKYCWTIRSNMCKQKWVKRNGKLYRGELHVKRHENDTLIMINKKWRLLREFTHFEYNTLRNSHNDDFAAFVVWIVCMLIGASFNRLKSGEFVIRKKRTSYNVYRDMFIAVSAIIFAAICYNVVIQVFC